jgi:uncharacterized protein YbjT (DUF2867 family)
MRRSDASQATVGPFTPSNDTWPSGRPRPCRVFSPCLPDDFAHAAAAAIARDAHQAGGIDESLRFVLRAALFDLQHRGFRVPDDLDPALANICGALMEDRLADG